MWLPVWTNLAKTTIAYYLHRCEGCNNVTRVNAEAHPEKCARCGVDVDYSNKD